MANTLNKADLIDAIVAHQPELTKKDAAAALEAFVKVVAETVARGDEINLIGFGKFHVTERAARVGRNPSTGKEIQIPASRAPKFTAGKGLKDALNG